MESQKLFSPPHMQQKRSRFTAITYAFTISRGRSPNSNFQRAFPPRTDIRPIQSQKHHPHLPPFRDVKELQSARLQRSRLQASLSRHRPSSIPPRSITGPKRVPRGSRVNCVACSRIWHWKRPTRNYCVGRTDGQRRKARTLTETYRLIGGFFA